MVLIFYAFRRELSGLRRRLKERTPLQDGLRGLRAHLGVEELLLVSTGIGAEQAAQTARRALSALPRPHLVISCGVAGALSAGLRAGDIVLADKLLLGGRTDYFPQQIMPLQSNLVRDAENALRRSDLPFSTGAMLTANHVLTSPASKQIAKAQSGAIAVDMESIAIGAETAVMDLPFICVRTVMDEAADELPIAQLADPNGTVAFGRAARFFLTNPAALTTIPVMIRKLSKATASLAQALEAICAAWQIRHYERADPLSGRT